MNVKKIFLNLFLLLVLLIGLVNAQEDFTASSLPSIELCPCSNQAYAVTIENTGTVASSYEVLASGTAVGWVNFNPDKFILSPGQKGSFFVFVNSDCNIEGDYELEIFITTTNGVTKVIKQVLEFSQCYDYSLERGNVIDEADESIEFSQHDKFYLLCKDEQKSIPILITNNENFGNRYRLFLDAPEWAGLNVGSAGLGTKKSGIFLINFDTTDTEGEFDFRLNAISELGKVQRKKSIEVNVGECYALELELEKEKDVVCGGEEKSYDAAIKNTGTLGQNVKLELKAQEWASVGNDSFYLGSGQEKILTLSVSPDDDVSGSFLVEVFAVAGNKTLGSGEVEIDVMSKSDCYKADISTKTSINNFYSHDLFFAKVKNSGIKKAAYDVSLEGVSWVSASPKTLELNPGQVGNINLNINPSTDVDPGTYGIEINLESNGAVYSKNVDIVLRKESEFMKKFKAAVKFYQYYIYLLILLIVLIIVFRKQIKKRYEKYKVKSERLRALRLARKKREEERERELEEKRKEEKKARKKEKKKKKFDIFFKKYNLWIYVSLLIAIGIFLGHQNRLFNARYLHLYIRNFFVGYLYYILIGIGSIVVIFLLFLFYNLIRKKREKVKKLSKKAEKRVRKKKTLGKNYFWIFVIILIGLLIYANSFNLFDDVRDLFILYQYYFVLGIVILVAIILLIIFYKPLFKFLKE
jgi:uncharacterized membrane protein